MTEEKAEMTQEGAKAQAYKEVGLQGTFAQRAYIGGLNWLDFLNTYLLDIIIKIFYIGVLFSLTKLLWKLSY